MERESLIGASGRGVALGTLRERTRSGFTDGSLGQRRVGGRISKALCSGGLLAAILAPALNGQDPALRQEAAAPQPSSSVTVVENVPYGVVNGVELRLDVYESPSQGAHPGVLLFHGGGWSGLDKGTMRRMGEFLGRSGFVAFSVDYRLLQGTENAWPAQLDDAQRAVRWVRANAATYHVDGARIGAFGHSAGAQLAALLGLEDTRDNSDPSLAKFSSRVQAVVDVSGPTDFTADQDSDGALFLARFLGGDYAHRPDVWRDASPVFHVSRESAPFLIVHGMEDDNVPISQAQQLFEKLQSAGVAVSFVKVDDGHTFRTPDARRQLAFETLAFFERHLVAPR